MKLRKMNTSWLMLGMVLVLLMACFMVVVNPAFARYQVESEGTANLQARPLEQIYLGQMVPGTGGEQEPVFDHEIQGKWYALDGVMTLEFAVANGKYEDLVDENREVSTIEIFAESDQRAMVRLVASPIVWDGTGEFPLTLRAPSRTTQGEFEEFQAVLEWIHPDSILYKNFGEGWSITFLDEHGQELSWLLEGGKLSAVEFALTLKGMPADENGQLKLQIVSDYTCN